MNRQAILHIPMSQYAYGADDTHAVFRLRSAANDLAAVTLIFGDRSCRRTPVDYFEAPMTGILSDPLFDWWEIVLETEIRRLCYAFRLTDTEGKTVLFYADQFHEQLTDERSAYYQLPYNHRADRADVPGWMKSAVVYNIFPDSFATGKRRISCKGTETTHDGQPVRGKLGGTIRGVTENLDYIQALGADCVYLNPVFAAGEYHKYDLIDYYHIDPVFGSDRDFRELITEAHSRGMRVIIDGVFNHCGWRFFAFRDVVQYGKSSRYWDWFFRLEEPVIVPDNIEDYPAYECFGYERMMPKLALDNPEVQAYFCDVGAYWVRNYDIDGWRLDVASEINDGFWRAFRQTVKAVRPDCALIGEVWESAGHWLNGSMFDSAMNYDFRKHCRAFFAEEKSSAEEFNGCVTDMLMRYRRNIVQAQMNLLDSHDVSRFLSLCGCRTDRMKPAILFQMTFVGMPTVFYGDEQGITGILEDEYRHPMIWKPDNHELFCFYQKAIALRRQEPVLQTGSYRCVEASGRFYHYERYDDRHHIHILLNAGSAPVQVSVSSGEILWQEAFSGDILSSYGFVVYRK